MRVKVLFFGQLKDITGRSEESAEVPAGASLETIFDYYAKQHPRMRDLRPSIVIARNHQFADASTPVSDGDEIAFLPPVSGGTAERSDDAGHIFELTRKPIDTQSIRSRVLKPEDGAVVVFEGVVRNNTKGRATKFLDYECYELMAQLTMRKIGLEIASSACNYEDRHGSSSWTNGNQRYQRLNRCERSASQARVRRRLRGHQPSEEACAHLEEGAFRRRRGLGGRRMGRIRPPEMNQ